MSTFDLSRWPLVGFQMPVQVADADAPAMVADFDALLDRNERFVLVMTGPWAPKKSKHFMSLYADWGKRRKHDMTKLCAGSVRLEPDPLKRGAFMTMLGNFLLKAMSPYPIAIVGTQEEVNHQAQIWLAQS